jgi:hypothetical protein
MCGSERTPPTAAPYRFSKGLYSAAMERAVIRSALHHLEHSPFDMLSMPIVPLVDAPADVPVDVKDLNARLWAAWLLAAPGFMTLHAVREGGHIVDFEWDFASLAATRLLHGGTGGLRGRRLVEVLAGHAGRGEVFNQYCRVVEFGAARAVRQMVEVDTSVDVIRHAAVHLRDGVAVSVTNLNAVRRERALRREIEARTEMASRCGR